MHATRRAFTLIEAVVSASIVGVLLLSMGSVMLLAGRAMPSEGDPARRVAEAARALDIMTAELAVAGVFEETQRSAVTALVPDRTGNGEPDRLRFAWSTTPGDPVTLAINGGEPRPLAANVLDLAFTYRPAGLDPVTIQIMLRTGDPGTPALWTRVRVLNKREDPS